MEYCVQIQYLKSIYFLISHLKKKFDSHLHVVRDVLSVRDGFFHATVLP